MGDENDRRLVLSLTQEAFAKDILEGPLKLLGSFTPPTSTLQALQEYITSIPEKDNPSIFGLSDIDEQIYQEKRAVRLLKKCAELLLPSQLSTKEVIQIASDLLDSIPEQIQVGDCQDQNLIFFHQSLINESKYYNNFFSKAGAVLKKIVESEREGIPFDRECLETVCALSKG